MMKDKRKAPRRLMRYTAWIALESKELLGCVLADISATGAKLDLESSEGVPDDFKLLLSRRGSPSRRCHVVWRAPAQLGVEFQLAHATNDGTRVPAMKSPAIVPESESDKSETVDVEAVPPSTESA